MITHIRADVVHEGIDRFVPPMSVEEQWDIEGLERHLKADFAIELPVATWLQEDTNLHEEPLRARIIDSVQAAYDEKGAMVGDAMRQIEKQVMLQVLDGLWKGGKPHTVRGPCALHPDVLPCDEQGEV